MPQVQGGSNAFFLPYVIIPNVSTIYYVGFSSSDDPFVNYFAAVENLTARAQTYSFAFVNPFVGGAYSVLNSSFGNSFTDGAVTVAVVLGQNFISQPQVDGNDFAGRGSGCLIIGPGGDSGSCNSSQNLDTVAIPSTYANGTFGVAVNFTLSPGDIYGFNGQASLDNPAAAPEPASYALMFTGTGLVCLGGWQRSRRNVEV